MLVAAMKAKTANESRMACLGIAASAGFCCAATGCDIEDKSVAVTGNSLEGLAIGTKSFAQRRHLNLQRVLFNDDSAPHAA